MSSEVSVSSFIISIDLVHPTVDLQTLSEYIKTNFKKEFIFFSGTDFVESSGGRSSRNDARGQQKKVRSDNSGSIARGIKNKIEAELTKLLESKKRHIAQQEKAKNKEQSKSKHKHKEPEVTQLYQKETEVVFCITNFPYTGHQFSALRRAGIDLGALISLEGQGVFPQQTDRTEVSSVSHKGDKSARTAAKRQLIDGSDMDSSLHPGVVPPLRWDPLKGRTPSNVIFSRVNVGSTVEEIWQSLQNEIGRIIKCRNEFKESFESRNFVSLPNAKDKTDTTIFQKIIKEAPNYFFSALLEQEKAGLQVPEPPKPLTTPEKYDRVISSSRALETRDVVKNDKGDEFIDFDEVFVFSHPSIYNIIYQLTKFSLKLEVASLLQSQAISTFYQTNSNFMAAAGQRFDQMVAGINKRLNLGLPPSFYDWQRWKFIYEHKSVLDELSYIVDQSCVVETYLDNNTGLLWVLAMPVVSRTVANTFRQYYIPPVIDGASEYFQHLFEKEAVQEKKSRKAETVSSIIKEGKFEQLLTPLPTRLEGDGKIYRLPIGLSDTVGLRTPYFFESGFRADIIRDIIGGIPTFSFKAYFHPEIMTTSNGTDVIINAYDCRVYLAANTDTIFWDKYTMYIDGSRIVISDSVKKISISLDGTVVLSPNVVIDRSLTIGRKNAKGEWIYTTPHGATITKDGRQQSKLSLVTDPSTKIKQPIRSDHGVLSIYPDGTKVLEAEGAKIRVSSDQKAYTIDVDDFPTIHLKDLKVDADVGCFHLSMSEKGTKLSADELEINKSSGKIFLNANGVEAVLTARKAEFKAIDEVLLAEADGTERFGTIGEPPSKKIPRIESTWGSIIPIKETNTEARLLSLNEDFCPRFFAIRPGFSATEFIHETQVPQCDQIRECAAPDLSSVDHHIVTFHTDGESPHGYIEYPQLDKLNRVNLLKTLQIPRPPKPNAKNKDQEMDIPRLEFRASSSMAAFYLNRDQLIKVIQGSIENSEEAYQHEVHPPEDPPEPRPNPPAQTPVPRLMRMQAMKSAQRVKDTKIVNYWESPEATFAEPILPNKITPRAVESRMSMFDLETPRAEKYDGPNPNETPRTSLANVRSAGTSALKMYRTEVSRPASTIHSPKQNVMFDAHRADFKRMRVGEKSVITFNVKNTATRPLHYSFTIPKNNQISILSVPGMVTPGLDLKVKIEFNAKTPGNVQESFNIITDRGNIPVVVAANVTA